MHKSIAKKNVYLSILSFLINKSYSTHYKSKDSSLDAYATLDSYKFCVDWL